MWAGAARGRCGRCAALPREPLGHQFEAAVRLGPAQEAAERLRLQPRDRDGLALVVLDVLLPVLERLRDAVAALGAGLHEVLQTAVGGGVGVVAGEDADLAVRDDGGPGADRKSVV